MALGLTGGTQTTVIIDLAVQDGKPVSGGHFYPADNGSPEFAAAVTLRENADYVQVFKKHYQRLPECSKKQRLD